ncbi:MULTISPECIES: ABC transporter ATP-binding protein [Caldanaerobacter]|jgi:ABC-2 type transport system ATP-binding protein|uniref:ABC-2 type transport system ATP-binding protein n=1 Tax=Caldanaerobacter subterraneus TaxID=911092 RepID=A0A4V2S9D8_9THEO|nr:MULTISPECIES: ABC transporter ATP-binding protein [Caldanaerobacter]MDI3518461.1 type transport system ATP-binding protein [Caldanaerobacter sp.]TCO67530.1 ABC-2 type transport system ATP-binding protein [Caldanaerobacter subterraneus]
MIKVFNLTKKYGNYEVLKGISFEIEKGTIYGLLGRNGAGKTTTMNILTGLIDYNRGEIYINGKMLDKNKRKPLEEIGYLPESPTFYTYMTGSEYLLFISKIRGIPYKKAKKEIDKLLDLVKLKEAANKKIQTYSRGMKQKLGLAVALLDNPEIIFLDEPTSALDPESRYDIFNQILEMKKNGKTILLSTHILSDAERVCDYIGILDKGKIIFSGKIKELKQKYALPIYDIVFENLPHNIKEKLNNVKWIADIKIKNDTVSIYINDIELAKKNILSELSKLDIPVISLQQRENTLEDIFIRLVKQNEYI